MAVKETGISASLANIAGAIRRASNATGASFDYLLATAKAESDLNPNVKAATSSATGLFQFIDQTWLATLKRSGQALGYGQYANAIAQTPDGGFTVPDASMRAAVLNLRRDPGTNAAMAGAFTQHNSAELRERLGRPATGGELYIAHFLGSTGAGKLIAQAATAPDVAAAKLFPAAAAANRSIFYNRQGRPRSAGEVYGILVGRFDAARTRALEVAGRAPAPAPVRPSAAAADAPADPAGTFDAFAMVSAVPVAKTAENGPAFHSLFQTGGQHKPISPLVGALWGGGGEAAAGVEIPASVRNGSEAAAGALRGSVDTHDLYRNGRSNVRGLFDGTS